MYAIRAEKPSFEPQQIWHALADPTRRGLLDRLAEGPCTTSDLCDGAPMSRFGIMKHLGILEDHLSGQEPRPFWRTHTRLEAEYVARLHSQ